MRAWQIAAVGVLALVLCLLLPTYESYLVPLCAGLLVAAVIFGFLLHPKRDVFYLTTVATVVRDGKLYREKGFVAVRLELVRLWSLFLPTMLALGSLLALYSQSHALRWSILQRYPSVVSVMLGRYVVAAVLWLILMWVNERRVLRDPALCRAKTMQRVRGRVTYSFRLRDGEWYGGADWELRTYARDLATVVFYDVRKPDLNKPAVSCWFHKLVVIGNGLTDLDEATDTLITGLTPQAANR